MNKNPVVKKHFLPFVLLLITISIFFNYCKPALSKEEAEAHLRAFDYELIRLIEGIQHTRSYRVLQELTKVENAPIPFFAHRSETLGGISKFNFDVLCGVYDFDSINRGFTRSGYSDSIIINYTLQAESEKIFRFVIAEYAEDPSSSSLMIPTRFHALLFAGEKLSAEIDHSARLEHKLPVELHTRVGFENYHLEADLTTRLRKDYGDVKIKTKVLKDSKEMLHWVTKLRVGMVESGSFFVKSINMKLSMYPVFLCAEVDNDAINSNAIDFIEEFNRYSKINVYRMRDNRKLCTIRLKVREASDKLDYAIYYSDSSFVFVDKLMLTADKIMNIKK
ncbi:MAG: hypothetical protein U1C46_05395 [Bacteroidales bacterium]|nr:hypothetical protein [Bacteroidales bacterium]MDZ4204235.1 hypothetical protein [Bacteroidales bacterium]